MKKLLLLTLCVAMATMMLAQTQKGYVKTKGRLGNDGQVIPGEPLSEVTIKVKDRNAVMSDKRGDFSFPMPDKTYYLEDVSKNGYVLIDPDVLSKQYSYSKNKLVVVLDTKANQLEERMEMNSKIMAAQRKMIDDLRAEVKQLKAENKITEEEYGKRLQKIVDMQEENQQMVEEMVERYSKIDYDMMSDFDCQFSAYLLNGDLLRADSLLNTKGDLTKRTKDYNQLKEANAKERENLETKRKKLEKSEAAAIKMRDDLASDCYKRFEILKMQHKNDLAAYWLEERVKLDTTNVEWQIDAGDFLHEYIADYDKAKYYYELGLRRAEIQYGYRNEWKWLLYNRIGRVFLNQSNYDTAMYYYDKAIYNLKCIEGEDNHEIARGYNDIGVIYYSEGDFFKAIEFYNKALLIFESLYGVNCSDLGSVLNNLGIVYNDMDEDKKALDYYWRALSIYKNLYGEIHQNVAMSYYNVSMLYYMSGEYDKSLEYNQKSLDIFLSIYGENHPNVASCYNNFGALYSVMGSFEKALEYHNKALNIRESIFGDKHTDVVTTYINLGKVYVKIGHDMDALACYLQALSITETTTIDKSKIIYCYQYLGDLYNDMGNYEKSYDYINQALLLSIEVFGENHSMVANMYNSIAFVCYNMGNIDKSLELFKKASTIVKNIEGRTLYYGDTMHNIGYVLNIKGDNAQALDYLNTALDVRLSLLNPDNYLIADSYHCIGNVYVDMRDYDKAMEYYNKALQIRERVYEENHPMMIKLKNKISEVEAKLAESNKK